MSALAAAVDHTCRICGHDRQQHASMHALKGARCCVFGCYCLEFAPVEASPPPDDECERRITWRADRVENQRQANAKMQQQVDSARSTAKHEAARARELAAHLAALEQAARDFLEQAAGGAVHGSSWDEFERTAERLRAAVDGTDSWKAEP
jgi:hypothetical protein